MSIFSHEPVAVDIIFIRRLLANHCPPLKLFDYEQWPLKFRNNRSTILTINLVFTLGHEHDISSTMKNKFNKVTYVIQCLHKPLKCTKNKFRI